MSSSKKRQTSGNDAMMVALKELGRAEASYEKLLARETKARARY